MKMKLAVSILVILIVVAASLGATMAWFTDSDEAAAVSFTAGTLSVDISDLDELDEINGDIVDVNLDILNPGDEWGWEFQVCNEGSKSFHGAIYFCWEDIIGQLNEDLEEAMRANLDEKDYGDSGLSEVVEWQIYQGETLIHDGTMPSEGPWVIDIEDDGELIKVDSGECLDFTVIAKLPTAAGNDYQGSKMNLKVGVLAWQTTNDAPTDWDHEDYDLVINCDFANGENGGENGYTVTDGEPGDFSKKYGFRVKGENSGNDSYLGVGDLSDGGNRNEAKAWQLNSDLTGNYSIEFAYNSATDMISLDIPNVPNGPVNLNYNVSGISSIDKMIIQVIDRDNSVGVALNNVQIDGVTIGDFGSINTTDQNGWQNWTVDGDFTASFTLTADLEVVNFTGNENNRVEVLLVEEN